MAIPENNCFVNGVERTERLRISLTVSDDNLTPVKELVFKRLRAKSESKRRVNFSRIRSWIKAHEKRMSAFDRVAWNFLLKRSRVVVSGVDENSLELAWLRLSPFTPGSFKSKLCFEIL